MKSAFFNLPFREIQKITNKKYAVNSTEQYATHSSFLGIANVLVIVFVKSERA